MPGKPTYADLVRVKLESSDNPRKRPMSIRELAEATGHSYEHCRKVLVGEPVVSRDFNEELCRVLGLDARTMWERARTEKAIRRFGDRLELKQLLVQSPIKELERDWSDLTDEDRRSVMRIVRSLAEMNRRETRRLRSAADRHAGPTVVA